MDDGYRIDSWPSDWPAPDAAAIAHSARVEQRLSQEIERQKGWLDFARFMELALYAPGLGYYAAGSSKLGVAGDFVTAPERGELFGRCLARSLLPILEQWPDAEILELGAGSGALAETVLRELEVHDRLPSRYCIVEPSPDFTARQRVRLQQLPTPLRSKLHWASMLPHGRPRGVILANEVMDALPVRRFLWTGEDAQPLGVVYRDGAFAWAPGAGEQALRVALMQRVGETMLRELPVGYQSEFCPVLPDWIRQVLNSYRNGVALLIDYGLSSAEYYHPQRVDGTLRCHYRHRAHDNPLILPGLQDITAWVDFSTAARAAAAVGWSMAGFATQAHFLIGSGLTELLVPQPGETAAAAVARNQEAKALTLPGEMGENFRVLGLVRGTEVVPAGFGIRDLRSRLGSDHEKLN